MTFADAVLFNSFTPSGAPSACLPAGGINRLYVISVLDGRPLTNLDGSVDPDLTQDDRFMTLQQGGIAPTPAFLFPADRPGNPVVCVGLECMDPNFNAGVNRTFWVQDESP